MTPEELKEHITCSLSTKALQRYIDDAEAEITYRFGDNSSITETGFPEQLTHLYYTTNRIKNVTEIIETVGTTETVLSANDYEVVNGIRIDRRQTGDNPRTYFGDKIKVTYTPVDKSKQRDRVVIDLVKLALAYNGVDSERIGDYKMTQEDYSEKREEILNTLRGRWWA